MASKRALDKADHAFGTPRNARPRLSSQYSGSLNEVSKTGIGEDYFGESRDGSNEDSNEEVPRVLSTSSASRNTKSFASTMKASKLAMIAIFGEDTDADTDVDTGDENDDIDEDEDGDEEDEEEDIDECGEVDDNDDVSNTPGGNGKSGLKYPLKCAVPGCSKIIHESRTRILHERSHMTEFQAGCGGVKVTFTRSSTDEQWPCPFKRCNGRVFNHINTLTSHVTRAHIRNGHSLRGVPKETQQSPSQHQHQPEQQHHQQQQQQQRSDVSLEPDDIDKVVKPVTTFGGSIQLFEVNDVECGYHVATGAFVCFSCNIVPTSLTSHLRDTHNQKNVSISKDVLPSAAIEAKKDPSANQHAKNPNLAVEMDDDNNISLAHSDIVIGFSCLHSDCTYVTKRSCNVKIHRIKVHNDEYVKCGRAVLLRYPRSSNKCLYMLIRRLNSSAPAYHSLEETPQPKAKTAKVDMVSNNNSNSTKVSNNSSGNSNSGNSNNNSREISIGKGKSKDTANSNIIGTPTNSITRKPSIASAASLPQLPVVTLSSSPIAQPSPTPHVTGFSLPQFIPDINNPLVFTQLDCSTLQFPTVCAAVDRLLAESNALLQKLMHGYNRSTALLLSDSTPSDLGFNQPGFGLHLSSACNDEFQLFSDHLKAAVPRLYTPVRGSPRSVDAGYLATLRTGHDTLLKMILMLIVVTGGVPLLDVSELAALRIVDGDAECRNLYLHCGVIVLLTTNTASDGTISTVVRLLPRSVSQLLLDYLVFIRRHLVDLLKTAQRHDRNANDVSWMDKTLFSDRTELVSNWQPEQYFGCTVSLDAFRDITLVLAEQFGIPVNQPNTKGTQITMYQLYQAFKCSQQWHQLLAKHGAESIN